MMKKIALGLTALLAMVNIANAQTDKGDWMVGGSMTINTTTGNSQFTLQPSAGYFFANNFVAGSELTLSFGKFGDVKTSTVGVGPFARYYFNLKSPNFKPFLNADFNFANAVSKYQDIKTSNTVTSFFIGGGGAFFINPNVALEAMAGYNRSKVESQDPANGFLFRVGFQVHLLGHEVARLKGN
jgi:hypothetical protein